MGSDLYMESQSFRPRANKGEWDGDDLVIMQDRFYIGYEIIWRGPVTPDNESLIRVMLPGGIPPKPPVKVSRREALHNGLDVGIFTDGELESVVEWIMDIFEDDEHYE